MRIYIIGNDGIRLCRGAPATVTDGEVAVASKEELHAAPLSGKRLLARTEPRRRPDHLLFVLPRENVSGPRLV